MYTITKLWELGQNREVSKKKLDFSGGPKAHKILILNVFVIYSESVEARGNNETKKEMEGRGK
jgi:hypothetical protein